VGFLIGEEGGGGGRGCLQHLHFLKVALTLGSMKSSIFQGAWKFSIFSIFFAKMKVHLDLLFQCSDFGFIKK
jgi:hypothetical protein